MQNVVEILKGVGVELTEEQAAAVNKGVAENYKTIAEFDKKVGKAETERDELKAQLTTAQETLKGFEGVDLETINRELADYKKKAEDSEAEFKRKLAERDFEDALRTHMEHIKFTSNAAKESVMGQIRAKGLKCDNGKILGFDDAITAIKATDADAFANEENPSAHFTSGMGQSNGKKYSSREEIMKIKNRAERQEAIAANPDLFGI